VSFSPNGRLLAVTEKATNLITTFTVGHDGLASAAVTHPSAGATPFGFAFGRWDTLIVSEAFGGAANASAVSSYKLNDGQLQVVSASAVTHQTAACWIAVTGNGKYAYTTNAGSGSISGYTVGHDGSLTLLNANGQTALIGGSVADMAFSQTSRYLYVFAGGTHQIVALRVHADGSLTQLGGAGIPAGAAGVAAY
jgi:6-phosphogluconolactonase